MNPTLSRLLNEAPTLAVLVVTVLGLGESDAEVWKEAVASIAGLVVWFTARGSIDGPATQINRTRAIRARLGKPPLAPSDGRDRGPAVPPVTIKRSGGKP